jgi:hypothetical protein
VLVTFEDPTAPVLQAAVAERTATQQRTIYTFLYPIFARLAEKSRSDLVLRDGAAWEETWSGQDAGGCGSGLGTRSNRTSRSTRFRLNGTPTIIFADGRGVPERCWWTLSAAALRQK